MNAIVRGITRGLSTAVCIMLLSACASTTSTNSLLEERAKARWEKLLSGDLAGAYAYLSPGFRSSVSSMDYQRSILMKKVRWTGADYKGSECEEATCKVKFLVYFSVAGAVPGVKTFDGEQGIEESWLLVDGQWYLVP